MGENKIESVKDAIQKLKDLKNHSFLNENYYDKGSRFPHGIWFRGDADESNRLVPSVFKIRKLTDDEIKVRISAKKDSCDEYKKRTLPFPVESRLFNDFQLRRPESLEKNYSTFDWLCLMRHYELPARLLDWTESILLTFIKVIRIKVVSPSLPLNPL